MSTLTDQSIAALHASGLIQGDVQVTGKVTAASLRTTAAGHDWAVITLADGGGVIDMQVPPRVWRDACCPVRLGERLTVSGLLDGTPDGLTVIARGVTVANPV